MFMLIAVPWSNASAQVEPVIVSATEEMPPYPAAEFAKAITQKDRIQAEKYTADFVQIPEIREASRNLRYQLVPSSEIGVNYLMVHFDEETQKGDRLAFIWELTVKDDRITYIRVLFDDANKLVDE